MNLQSVFEELNKLYESVEKPVEEEEVVEQEVVEDEAKELTESADEEEIEIEIEDDEEEPEEEIEEVEEVATQFVLECSNCGGIIVKQDVDVEEDGAVEVADACQYCEAENSYKVIGTMMPYEAAEEAQEVEEVSEEEPADEEIQDEPVEEGFFGVDIPVTANVNVKADGNNVPVMNTGI